MTPATANSNMVFRKRMSRAAAIVSLEIHSQAETRRIVESTTGWSSVQNKRPTWLAKSKQAGSNIIGWSLFELCSDSSTVRRINQFSNNLITLIAPVFRCGEELAGNHAAWPALP
ncbi:hypothetical protein HFO94_11695 [Rhizobium leguminosarum]|uniref:hypothetical protein n=1 Tax=Rhizobium leguminosarum TaxID=384 RepID=UPI001C9717CB|nr:hypothetical protein [Rhizobium leguminosarum]MBY5354186.1 hypothetical protein [Rhizobium leguminosarum]